ncbi:hypothetical protein, partial [Nitrobacter sp.]|uniref:hypothetical protein n=1 Tax=Nitrobacter sp. TaxID=29420 RepID=UPI001D31E13B
MVKTIVIAPGDIPNATVKRRVGKHNAGLYCKECAEFFAVAVYPDGADPDEVRFESSGLLAFACPFCEAFQKREASEIGTLLLTEGRKRRPPLSVVRTFG